MHKTTRQLQKLGGGKSPPTKETPLERKEREGREKKRRHIEALREKKAKEKAVLKLQTIFRGRKERKRMELKLTEIEFADFDQERLTWAKRKRFDQYITKQDSLRTFSKAAFDSYQKKYGIKQSICSSRRKYALHGAALANDLEALRMLMIGGVDVYETNASGNTALHAAVTQSDNPKVVQLFHIIGRFNLAEDRGKGNIRTIAQRHRRLQILEYLDWAEAAKNKIEDTVAIGSSWYLYNNMTEQGEYGSVVDVQGHGLIFRYSKDDGPRVEVPRSISKYVVRAAGNKTIISSSSNDDYFIPMMGEFISSARKGAAWKVSYEYFKSAERENIRVGESLYIYNGEIDFPYHWSYLFKFIQHARVIHIKSSGILVQYDDDGTEENFLKVKDLTIRRDEAERWFEGVVRAEQEERTRLTALAAEARIKVGETSMLYQKKEKKGYLGRVVDIKASGIRVVYDFDIEEVFSSLEDMIDRKTKGDAWKEAVDAAARKNVVVGGNFHVYNETQDKVYRGKVVDIQAHHIRFKYEKPQTKFDKTGNVEVFPTLIGFIGVTSKGKEVKDRQDAANEKRKQDARQLLQEAEAKQIKRRMMQEIEERKVAEKKRAMEKKREEAKKRKQQSIAKEKEFHANEAKRRKEKLFVEAAQAGNLNEVKRMLSEEGVDIYANVGNHGTALHCAAKHTKNLTLVKFLLSADVGGLRLLNEQSFDGDTPLMCAAFNNSKEVFTYFIERGADVTLTNKAGDSALHVSVNFTDDITLPSLLLDASDELLDATNKDGWSPLMTACACNRVNCVKLLLERGADMSITDHDECDCFYLAQKLPAVEKLLKRYKTKRRKQQQQ